MEHKSNVEMEHRSNVAKDPAFLKPKDLGGASNGGCQKYHTKKAEIERIVDSVEKKKKMKKVLEEVKLEAVKLEEKKKMVKEDASLGLGPMTDGPVTLMCSSGGQTLEPENIM